MRGITVTRAGIALFVVIGCGRFVSRTPAEPRILLWDTPSRHLSRADAIAGVAPATDRPGTGAGGLHTRIILPDGYKTNRHWPVLYLLHGAGFPGRHNDPFPLTADQPESRPGQATSGVAAVALCCELDSAFQRHNREPQRAWSHAVGGRMGPPE